MESVVITGLGVQAPGLANIESMLTLSGPLPAAEFDPVGKLGRHGLRYKDRATKLALCAVHDALLDAGLPASKLDEPETTGVVASSNLGNIDTVCQIVQTLRQGSVEDLSPMDVPNASSNVIATTVAIRFGCRAVNLMLCNGATSGIDALYVAANVIRAGRARRMLVVGVEPRNEFVDKLATVSLEQAMKPTRKIRLADGAACVVLEASSTAVERGARIYGTLGEYCHISPASDWTLSIRRARGDSAHLGLWLTPSQCWTENRSGVNSLLSTWEGAVLAKLDLNLVLGELYGALGVFQAVAACLWLRQRLATQGNALEKVLATSGGTWGDGMASLIISA